MKISARGWVITGTCVVALVAIATTSSSWLIAQDGPTVPSGQLTEQSLGNLLQAMGLEPKKVEKRYDFAFKAVLNKEEWDLSMTAVLSQDGSSIWVMAWLDELPRSAADVPRTALLRLLADNDRLGNGKFFAYVAKNRRFVLQRVVLNQNLSTTAVRDILKDLGGSVVETYSHWAVENWKRSTSVVGKDGKTSRSSKPESRTSVTQPGRSPARSATNRPNSRIPLRR